MAAGVIPQILGCESEHVDELRPRRQFVETFFQSVVIVEIGSSRAFCDFGKHVFRRGYAKWGSGGIRMARISAWNVGVQAAGLQGIDRDVLMEGGIHEGDFIGPKFAHRESR